MQDWVAGYVRRRYGPATPPAALQAWQILLDTVYTCRDLHNDHVTDIPQSRPGLHYPEAGMYGLRPHLWYDPAQVSVSCYTSPAACLHVVTSARLTASLRLTLLNGCALRHAPQQS